MRRAGFPVTLQKFHNWQQQTGYSVLVWITRFAFFVLILCPVPIGAQTTPLTTPANPASPEYVGGAVCQTCHPNIVTTFFKNPHYRSVASGKEPPERTGCEGCHGPGKKHVEARGGKSTIAHAYSIMQPKQILDSCLTCHGKDFPRANIRRSSHTQSDVVCTNCHAIHKAQATKALLAKLQTDLCYGCHTNVRAQFSMPFKHRVNEGFMQCTDCHNPHGAPAPTWRMGVHPRMVDQAETNEEPCL